MFVPDTAKEHVRVLKKQLQVFLKTFSRLAASQTDVKTEFDFLFELICIFPNSVREVQALNLAGEKCVTGFFVVLEVSAILGV